MTTRSIPLQLLAFLKRNYLKIILIIIGFLSLFWFLVRVIPKPSRAAYPCQRAAYPMASAFVIWLTGLISSAYIFSKGSQLIKKNRYPLAVLLVVISIGIFLFTQLQSNDVMLMAYNVRNNLSKTPIELKQYYLSDTSTVIPAAIVGAVKSDKSSVFDIDTLEIQSMVYMAIERAGGFNDLIEDGDTVILKPNLVSAEDYSETSKFIPPEANGIATDYRVIQAVVNAVRNINPNGKIYMVEGSATHNTPFNMNKLKWDQVTGLDSIVCLENICTDWFDTTCTNLVGVSLPEDKYLYYDGDNRYWLYDVYYNADVLISLPVVKNHSHTGITGAVKNVGIGATPAKIYGKGPGQMMPNERWHQIEHGLDYSPRLLLNYWIHDYYLCRKVDFVIMDGLQGLDYGPVCANADSLEDCWKNMRLMLASRDPIAIDAIECLLAAQDPYLITHLTTLHNDSIGCLDPRLIRVNGIKTGDEKQDFFNQNSGYYTKYSDFDPPTFSVDACSVNNNDLCLNLTVDEEVVKVEVTIDGHFMNQIRIDNFNAFCLDLDTFQVDYNTEIMVYAYDKYLNYSKQQAQLHVMTPEKKSPSNIKLYPNPVKNFAKLKIENVSFGSINATIYDITGKIITSFDFYKKGILIEEIIDLSYLNPGNYYMTIQYKDNSQTVKFIKSN